MTSRSKAVPIETITEKQVEDAILKINEIVENHPSGSALRGLELATAGLLGLLDIYAQPNEANPVGMCDDPWILRQHFVAMARTLPILKKKIKLRR